MPFDPETVRKDFPVLAQKFEGGNLVYFDNAASAQKPLCVIEKEADFYKNDYSNIHRSAHELSRRSTTAYENARKTIGEFFKKTDEQSVVFTRGATEALNIIAHSWGGAFLKTGDEIILSQMEHHANIVPWQIAARKTGAIIKVASLLPDGSLDMDALAALANKNTKIISVCHASNVLGTVNELKKISVIARGVGAIFSVDAAQSAPHFLDRLQEIDCDFLSLSAHKCFGPTGTGALIGKTEILDKMDPWMGGGDMIENVSWQGTTYRGAPERFEAGTPNIAGVVAFAEALKYLSNLDKTALWEHEQKLLELATQGLLEIPNLNIHGTAKGKLPIVSFSVKGIHPNDISTMLDLSGIAVRSGHHCAEPLACTLGIKGSTRASFAFYNTLDEVDFFVKKLKSILRILL